MNVSAHADPLAEGCGRRKARLGRLLGVQAGQDFLRRENSAGARDAAGFYVAYVRSDRRLDGLVTNATATSGQRMEYAVDLSVKADKRLSLYAQGGFQHGIREENYEHWRGFSGSAGLRYVWWWPRRLSRAC